MRPMCTLMPVRLALAATIDHSSTRDSSQHPMFRSLFHSLSRAAIALAFALASFFVTGRATHAE